MAKLKHLNKLEFDEVVSRELRIMIHINLSIVFYCRLHKEVGALEGRANVYDFLAIESANDSLVSVASGNAYMNRWLNERVVFNHEVLLELYKLFLYIHGGIDGPRCLIVMVQEV